MFATIRVCVPALLLTTLSAQTVFQSDFDSAMPAQVNPGSAALVGVQGLAGFGPASHPFAGQFLRSGTGNTVTVSLAALPAHDTLSIRCLFAAIDSLDGAWNYPNGDWFRITVDGVTVFRESFANASSFAVQTYMPPAGVELARRVDLGFSGPGNPFTDSAYDFGADPYLATIPHSATSATIAFVMEGPGNVPLSDESWGIDNLEVQVNSSTFGTAIAYGPSCGPRIEGRTTPSIGRVFQIGLSELPVGSSFAFGAFGLSQASLGANVLPLPLDSYGLQGCWLVQDAAILTMQPYAVAGTNASTGWLIPNSTMLSGLHMFHQAWVLASGANTGGVATSNGLRIRIGGASNEIVENFSTTTYLDRQTSSGTWAGGAHPGLVGGDGRHGSFDPALGGATATDYTWDTTLVTIPGSLTPSGTSVAVSDGRFYFTDFTLPAGVTLKFTGPVPPQIFVRGKVRVEGTIQLNAAPMTTFNARGATNAPAPYVAGQQGGTAGPGGGHGGKGGDECQGAGPQSQLQNGVVVWINNGQNGADVQLLAGHAYALSAAGTGGHGATLFPANGLTPPSNTSSALSGIYNPFFAAGGSGGGMSTNGSAAIVNPFTMLQVSPVPTPGQLFNLFPFPPVSAPNGYSSLNHFLVGGSGGGGGASHAFGTFNIAGSTFDRYIAGAGGSGGGGALALRAGGDLWVTASASLQAKGGAGVLIRGNDGISTNNVNWGVTSPGGGGSGGSFLLQSGANLTMSGAIDTAGGQGSRTGQVFTAQYNVTSVAGNGSPGTYRLEGGNAVNFAGIGCVPAFSAPEHQGPLQDRDPRTGCQSLWYSTGLTVPPQWLGYELDVDTDGDGVTDVTYSDSGAAGTQLANDPNGPVTVQFQGAQLAPATGLPVPSSIGPWREGVGTGAVPGLNLDAATGYRFVLTFHRGLFPNCVVKRLRVMI